jgi:hypothetical protein
MFEWCRRVAIRFSNCFGSAKNNWMSDHWENVTDNVEALLDMVLAKCASS